MIKDEINLRIWGGRVVSDAVVNSRIRSARQILGDSGQEQRLIETVRGMGFRFAADVTSEVTAASKASVFVPTPLRPPSNVNA